MTGRAGTGYKRATCLWLSELATWRPGLINRLCERYGSLQAALERPRQELAEHLAPRRSPAEQHAESTSDAALFRCSLGRCAPLEHERTDGSCVLAYVDPTYPTVLRQLHDPPPALYVRGAGGDDALAARLVVLAEAPKVAVVGSRSCSSYGLEMATGLAADLAAQGVVVISGLAMGADAAAHRGALHGSRGLGVPLPTVAVLGCGADVTYPKTNSAVRTAVARRGLIVSEFVWGTAARGWRFPSRNRIMAGLCHAVVVVEGSTRSGALITARHARDLDREVFAVPGEAGRRLSMGPHELIRSSHALLCESADDVLTWLSAQQATDPVAAGYIRDYRRASDRSPEGLPATATHWQLEEKSARRVMERLDAGPATADDLCGVSGASLPAVMALLSALELQGLARPDGGGRYRSVRGRTTASD